jgi:hypothetical protein
MTTTTTHPTFPLNNNLTTVSIGAQFGSPHWISDTSTMQSWFCKTSAGMYDSAHFFTCAIAALLVFSFKSFSADGSLNGPGILCVCLRAYNYIFFSRFNSAAKLEISNCASRQKREETSSEYIRARARTHAKAALSKSDNNKDDKTETSEKLRAAPPFPTRVRKRQRRHK